MMAITVMIGLMMMMEEKEGGDVCDDEEGDEEGVDGCDEEDRCGRRFGADHLQEVWGTLTPGCHQYSLVNKCSFLFATNIQHTIFNIYDQYSFVNKCSFLLTNVCSCSRPIFKI